MTIPATGAVSFSQINTELGFTSTTQRNLGDTVVRTLAGVATGAIAVSNLRGKSDLIYTISPSGSQSFGTVPVGGTGSFQFTVNRSSGAGSITLTPQKASWSGGFENAVSISPASVTLSPTNVTGTFTLSVTVPSGTGAGTGYTGQWYIGAFGDTTKVKDWTLTVPAPVSFTPTGGASAGAAVLVSSDVAFQEAEVIISCNQNATWNYVRTLTSGVGTEFVSLATGGVSTGIIFRLDAAFGQLARRTWSLSATTNGITEYWTIDLRSEYV